MTIQERLKAIALAEIPFPDRGTTCQAAKGEWEAVIAMRVKKYEKALARIYTQDAIDAQLYLWETNAGISLYDPRKTTENTVTK